VYSNLRLKSSKYFENPLFSFQASVLEKNKFRVSGIFEKIKRVPSKNKTLNLF